MNKPEGLPRDEDIRRARKMLRQKVPMADVIAAFNNRYTEAAIIAGIQYVRDVGRARARIDGKLLPWNLYADQVKEIPQQVLADRDHRATLVPRDTTAMLMGDPVPGYSAAERRSPPSFSIGIKRRNDHLDNLLYRQEAQTA